MRVKKLSPRLEAMAGFVRAGESVADVGADHAILPIYLVREGISPFAVLTDVNPGPLEKTRLNIEKANGHKRDGSFCVQKRTQKEPSLLCPTQKEPSLLCFDLRLGDGLAALAESEVDTVIIAGMGGETIISILEADPGKALSFGKYILQPRTKTGALELWLAGSGWRVLEKTAADERGRLCDIIVCAPKAKEERDSDDR